MKIESSIPLIDQILDEWKDDLKADYEGYKNHVYRMVHFCLALKECSEEEHKKIEIAGAFHDLGIWSHDTVDYLPPSIELAQAYLQEHQLENWSQEIKLMIDLHHRIRPYKDDRYPLVELFRRADLVDVSLGFIKNGIPKGYIKEVKSQFPNAGFHKRLGELTVLQLKRDPFNPAPMMKW